MTLKTALRPSGWRKTAVINTVLVAVLTLMLATLVGVVGKNSGSLTKNYFLYRGSCKTAGQINAGLHLVINIIAMGILASSNFFMQVLNAPSRSEIDTAHRSQKMLDIGVQSASNMRHLSRFKVLSAVVLGLSSLPIHLVFNSVVFQSDFLGGSWQMTFAAEPFVNGTPYALPGAWQAISGFWPDYSALGIQGFAFGGYYGAGEFVNISDYTNSSSPVVSGIARAAADSAKSWVRLDPRTCRRQYIACEPRRAFGDVVVVINTGNDTRQRGGWTREQTMDTAVFDQESAQFWDNLGLLSPADQVNPLWYSALCSETQSVEKAAGECRTRCGSLIGGQEDFNNLCPVPPTGGSSVPDVSLCALSNIRDSAIYSDDGNWTIVNDWPPPTNLTYSQSSRRDQLLSMQHRAGFDVDGFSNWNVEYCLAEDVSNNCKVGVSGVLLLVVAICVAIKTVQCIVVLVGLKEDPLVTPGDAIESFLLRPDTQTKNMCTLTSLQMSRYWQYKVEEERIMPWDIKSPQKWRQPDKRSLVAVRPGVWLRTYGLFAVWLGVALWFFVTCVVDLGHRYADVDGKSRAGLTGLDHTYEQGLLASDWLPKTDLIPSILIANAPQLILSLNYLVYNALWTRMHSELEWNGFGVSYRPLRVSSPKGQQTSVYRLQLPYLYGVPLALGSVLLHWLVSNSVYVLVVEGDYLASADLGPAAPSPGIYINVGYSTGPMLAAIIICVLMSSLPLIFGIYRKLQADMPVMGNNSWVISAACHPLLRPPDGEKMAASSPGLSQYDNNVIEEAALIVGQDEVRSAYDGSESGERIALTQGKLKWGAVGSDAGLGGEGIKVGHLAFAGEEEEVLVPEEGRLYQ